ncbi:MAG TPA: DUF255 domain-containing protein [Candidatus Angelobacter sp.]|nr:DUF255 domain-containing protein [Candidatus Angelobacter sp.]
MILRKLVSICLLGVLIPLLASAQKTTVKPAALKWQPWSDEVFAQAKREHRFVLLDLEAIWCHWCHVMDETTYKDPRVMRLLNSRYILVKVDQDSRPDLSNRYEDYGWPATVVFDAGRHEIVKRQGYLPPKQMASILQAIIDDPTPGPSIEAEPKLELPSSSLLTAALRTEVHKNYLDGYDQKEGSWGTGQKFLDWDSVEYSMALARRDHDAQAEHKARQTLAGQLHLVDPVWGGVYQYSAGPTWTEPHFEKIMQMQAENLRIYSLSYAQWHDPVYLHAAQDIRRYLKAFLTSPEGAFYTSQDADLIEGKHSGSYYALDDAQRRKLGIPRIDKNMYARENGWAIAALATFCAATGDTDAREQALQATRWVLANRSLPNGGFRHGSSDAAGPYLGDNVSMARAFLALYGATADRQWLAQTENTITFIDSHFRDPRGAGFVTATGALPQRDENAMLARTANLLFHYTSKQVYQDVAQRALRYLAAVPVVYRRPASTVLLADLELASPPLHLTVVGAKDDAAARDLFQAALRYPSTYKRLEWWDHREGPLPNPDVQYPELKTAAAFVCTDRTCSTPIYKADELQNRVDKLLHIQGEGQQPAKTATAQDREFR